jgi:hypothetical protein
MRTEQEIEIIKLEQEFKDFLKYSTLSADDKQHLRSLSADYAIICATLPEGSDEGIDYQAVRRTALDHLSADFPELAEDNPLGLRRISGSVHGTVIVVDGRPMSPEELQLVYALIEPSKEVLDRAGEDAAYFYIAEKADEKPVEVEPVVVEPVVSAEYDIDAFEPDEMPAIEDKHTLTDELRPIAKALGGMVISLVGRRPADNTRSYQQKIAS